MLQCAIGLTGRARWAGGRVGGGVHLGVQGRWKTHFAPGGWKRKRDAALPPLPLGWRPGRLLGEAAGKQRSPYVVECAAAQKDAHIAWHSAADCAAVGRSMGNEMKTADGILFLKIFFFRAGGAETLALIGLGLVCPRNNTLRYATFPSGSGCPQKLCLSIRTQVEGRGAGRQAVRLRLELCKVVKLA